jgi:chemotaxis protein MotB
MSAWDDEDDALPTGAPAWTVTFADLMSLLLTFFILLTSLSDQQLGGRGESTIASLARQFGHEAHGASLLPAPPLPGDKIETTSIFARQYVAASGVLFFHEDSADLPAEALATLRTLAPRLVEQPYLVEVRGHASAAPIDGSDHWDLAYQRCHAVMRQLVELGVSPRRLRLTSAGDYTQLTPNVAPLQRVRNARVEVVMWDELVR